MKNLLFSKTNIKKNIDNKRKLIKIAMFSIVLAIICVSYFDAKTNLSIKENATISCASMAGFGFLSIRNLDAGGGGGNGETEEQKAQREFMDKVKLETKSAIDALELKHKDLTELQKKESEKQILELKNLLDGLTPKTELKSLQDKLNEMGLEVKALQEAPATTKIEKKSWKDALSDAWLEKKSEIDAILKNNGRQDKPLRLEIKSAITMSDEATIEAVGSASHYSLTSFTGIISKLRKRILRYLESVSVGGLSVEKPYAMWIEELDEQGTPIFIGEGDAKTQLSVRYEEREKKAKKIAVYGKVTTEMMRFLPQLMAYIQNNLIKRMDIKTEDQLFNGDDAGDNLKGLIPYSTAFDGGVGTAGGSGLVGLVLNANNYDVMRAIALQVENSYGIPSRVFVTPDAIAQMDIDKDLEGRYLLPPFKSASGTMISGLELVGTNALSGTGYDFVGGDLSAVNVSFLEEAVIQIGLDGNDFTQNKKTILVEQMLVQFVSANDTQVLVKGDFATAKALLEMAPTP